MDLHLAIRVVHVVAATLVIGGMWVMAALLRPPIDEHLRASMALRFEWLFWGAFGVSVATGVGNAGAFGASLPATDTRWGTVFGYKLAAVIVLGALSMVRTLSVARSVGGSARALLSRLYAWSAALGTTVVVLAEVLAHG